MAFIPFASAILVAPTGLAILAITAAGVVAQALHRRHWLKALFNVSQMALAMSLGILAFRFFGGNSFFELRSLSVFETARRVVVPTLTVNATLLLVNTLLMSGVVAITQGNSVVKYLRTQKLVTAPFFLLIAFFTFYMTWLYINLGPLGTAGLAIPMIGVRQLYRTTIELSNVTEELLDLMVAAIEARDPYTSGHSQRVARASRIIAHAIGMKPDEVERVGVAALLHDVGKIDEAFAPILAKEGRLTPEEWELMKRHPIRSAELVGLLSNLSDLVAPVRHHHENWDGTGYPDGLRGNAIPLAARIIMFADTLDAMTTDRPYRKALSMEEARNELIKFKGRQFDPAICDVVVAPELWLELYRSFTKPVSPRYKSKVS